MVVLYFSASHELTYKLRNFICFGIKSEVPSVENVDLSIRYVPANRIPGAESSMRGRLPPKSPAAALPFAHPFLPLGVGVDVRAVVIESRLNIHLAGLAKKGKFIGPEIRGNSARRRSAPYMARGVSPVNMRFCAKLTL